MVMQQFELALLIRFGELQLSTSAQRLGEMESGYTQGRVPTAPHHVVIGAEDGKTG